MEIIETIGMKLFLGTQAVHKDAEWTSRMPSGFWFGGLLNGSIDIERPGLGELSWSDGDCACFWLDKEGETFHRSLQSGEMGGLFFHITPENLELMMGAEPLQVLGLRKGNPELFFQLPKCALSQTVKSMIWQMLGSPVAGPGRACFLAGKALEILGVMLDQAAMRSDEYTPEACKSALAGQMAPADIERMYAVRDAIVNSLDDPPSVQKLATSNGICVRKLGDHFNGVFGVPVYSYIKSARMCSARLMIEAGETSMSKVAYSFGYTPSHFSTEFRKLYGISPKAFSQGKKPPLLYAER